MKEYTFTTYNIFKLHLPFSRQAVGKLCSQHDFVAIQEWVSTLRVRNDENIVTCPTFVIPFRNTKTGTATISRHKPKDSSQVISSARELGIATRKSMLVTTYELHNGKLITIANIHSLNFVLNHTWKKQIDHFVTHLPKSGPLIFAGDFNTWNPWRFDYLEHALSKIHLHYANYDHNIILRLDHIFTRDIEMIETKEDENIHCSDHYPVTMKFRVAE
jgi:endonuclease/exonuclease/phosphatase (EEP) superfamily protein YafD